MLINPSSRAVKPSVKSWLIGKLIVATFLIRSAFLMTTMIQLMIVMMMMKMMMMVVVVVGVIKTVTITMM